MPFFDGGELFNVLSARGRFTESECRFWFKQMLVAVEALQKNDLCHRDISLENMLTSTSDGLCVVYDFGNCLKVPYTEENEVRRRCLINLDTANGGSSCGIGRSDWCNEFVGRFFGKYKWSN